MTDKPRIIPAVARVDTPRKPTKQQKLAQARQISAWQRTQRKDTQR